MDRIERLRDALQRAMLSASDGTPSNDQELFEELMVQKSRLLQLFDVGPRSAQEQREVESGKITIDGKQIALNSDYARQVLFISQHLECSEKYVASVLNAVMRRNSNLSPVEYIEETIVEFYNRRRLLADSIELLLNAALHSDASSTLEQLRGYVYSELLPSRPAAGGELTFGHRLFKAIQQHDAVIAKVDVALKNATSNTVSPSQQNQGVLGHDIIKGRLDSLLYERRQLAVSLITVARHGFIEPNQIQDLLNWLSEHHTHPLAYYILTTVFVCFDPEEPGSQLGSQRQAIATNTALISYMTKKFAPTQTWKEPGLKAAILLKWTMFITDARHNDGSLEHRAGFKNEELETQVWNGVQGDSFTYLALTVARVSRKSSKDALPPSLVTQPVTETTEQPEIPSEDTKLLLLSVFESLLRAIVMYASSELRKIKQKQEDIVLANARTDRNRVSSRFGAPPTQELEKAPQQPRHDIAILYSFIGLLYSALPAERALQFWGASMSPEHPSSYMDAIEASSPRLPAFLQWAVWSTSPQDLIMLTALYDMITGLSKGPHCSELAYNFLARGTGEVIQGSSLSSSSSAQIVSWTSIFGILDAWFQTLNHAKAAPQPQPQGFSFSSSIQNLAQPPQQAQQLTIGPKDVLFAQSFLRLLATVVTHSVTVRAMIASHSSFNAIPRLVSLIPLSLPLELKGALFDTLSAFCEPGAGSPGQDICHAVWTLMERAEVINVRGTPGGFSSGKGVEVELEQIEAVHRLYPATIPFLKLLSTLIHTAKRLPEKDRAIGMIPSNTIPQNLGQPYRLPGIAPFTSFVVDNVFINIPNRDYSSQADRWRINDLCLCYVERALASFNLESLVEIVKDGPTKVESLSPFLVHPGFDVATRLLSSSPLQTAILTYLVEGLAGFETGMADEEPYFRNTIIRVLRIVLRLLEIQDIFLDVLLPLLSEVNTTPYIGRVHHRSFFTKLDQALSFDTRYAPAIAQYMEYTNHSEGVLLAIKILSLLSTSSYFSNLTALVERSPSSERILAAFVKLLNTSVPEDITQTELDAELQTGAGAESVQEGESLEQAIRLAALDLLIQDTNSGRAFPNLGHWLLFGTSQSKVQDPAALHSRKSSIHVLLELVNHGVPRRKDRRQERSQVCPLAISLPALAERCYRVIYQLATHPKTSDFVTRYLRTREDFFVRQISIIPSQVPEANRFPPIQVVYGDGAGVLTTVDTLSSFLRLRSYIFDLVALELHMLTNKSHHKGVAELLDILFGADSDYEETHGFPTFHEVGQSNMRIVDFFQSLLFEWEDSLSVNVINLQFLGQLNLQASIRKDVNGCDVVDRPTLLSMLASARQALYVQGNVATSAQNDQLNAETNYVLESCAIENHRRQIAFSVAGSFESWRRLLDLALTKCFDRLPHDRRENMLFELLHVLPAAIRSQSIEEPTAVLLSECTLSLITKLREDRRYQLILQSTGTHESASLPAERLNSILQSIIEGILDSNHSELIRGNLYGTLINFIHLILTTNDHAITTDDSTNDFGSTVNPYSAVVLGHTGNAPGVELGVLAALKPVLERIVAIIARDAIDGTEVWKTVAFMLLDAVVQLSSLEKSHSVLGALERHGILHNFVGGLKDSDPLLQSILKPDPDDLNPLYVYESKMSLFIRMSQTRQGAERLLEAQFIPVLSQCDYLDSMPEADQAFMDHDSFLPSAIQRYHQLFTPAIQAVNGIVAILGSKHTTATSHALDFLSNHASTIAILLKSQADYVTLAILEEIHLVVNLCANVLPTVPRNELLSSTSGFGVIHAAILSLAARSLGQGRTFERVIPNGDAEVQESNVYAFGHGGVSKFDLKVRRKEELLRKGIISYIGSASEFTESEINLVLSPITVTPKRDEQGSRFSATVPTIGDALAALDDLTSDLAEVLKQISDIGAELASKHHVGSSDVQEILRDFDPTLLQALEPEQTRSLIYRELKRIALSLRNDAKGTLDATEMLMLLIWRHLEHYAEPKNMNMPPAKASVANAMRLLQTADPITFRSEAGIKLAPILQKLSTIDLGSALSNGKGWQESQGYIEIMCRRLKDTAGLLEDADHFDMDP